MKSEGMTVIVTMCIFVLFIIILKTKSRLMVNLIFRGLVGTVCIILCNYACESYQIPLQIELNPVTVLTCTILGFPGFILLFGIHFYLLL